MDKEKLLKIATAKLESRKTHRIDRLRKMSGIGRDEFDLAIMELAQGQKLELVGGDTSSMTDKEIRGLIRFDGNIFVNIVWLIPIPVLARPGKSRRKMGKTRKAVHRE